MKKIKIITDSTAYISREDAEAKNISVVPLSYTIDGKSEKEGYPGEFDEFFKAMEDGSIEVTTSQPAVGDFIEAYEKAFEDGYEEIIAILMSSKVSGTYNSAKLAKETIGKDNIRVIDTLTSAGNLKELVFHAFNMVKEGRTSSEVEAYIESKIEASRIFIIPDTLKHLEKGGRISKLGMLIGNLLNVKPIIELKDGELGLGGKARGKKQAFAKVMDMIPENIENITVCPIYSEEDGNRVYEMVKEQFPNAKVIMGEIGIVVGGHVGPNSIGICII